MKCIPSPVLLILPPLIWGREHTFYLHFTDVQTEWRAVSRETFRHSGLGSLIMRVWVLWCPLAPCYFQFAFSSLESIFIFYFWKIVSSFVCTTRPVNSFILWKTWSGWHLFLLFGAGEGQGKCGSNRKICTKNESFSLLLTLLSLLYTEGLDLQELAIIPTVLPCKNVIQYLTFLSSSTAYKHVNVDKPILEN